MDSSFGAAVGSAMVRVLLFVAALGFLLGALGGALACVAIVR